MDNNSISYIFPVYNEAQYLEKQIEYFLQQIKKNHLALTNIILVENGSTDNSWIVCKKLAIKNKKIIAKRIAVGSYGLAVKHGLLSSNSDILVLLNVDFFDIEFIRKALPLVKKFTVVNGSKLHKESSDQRNYIYKLRTKVFNFFLNTILRYPGTDTHGIKVFHNTKKLQDCINTVVAKHELFDTELLYRLKDSVTELPITINEIRPTRYTSFTRIKKTATDIARIVSFLLFAKKNNPNVKLKVADDYGINKTTSVAILDLFSTQQVNVISILPNMVTAKELFALHTITKNCNIAIHLNLVRGKPLTDPDKIPSLLARNSKFYSLPELLLRLIFKKIDLSEIELELQNQIEFILKKGFKAHFINSEQHVHAFAPVNMVVKKLANKYEIKNVRSTKTIKDYLSWRIHKYFVFIIVDKLLAMIYQNNEKNVYSHEEIISHPGSNYD